MPVSTSEKRATFRRMHESGCFVIPNPWDVGTARALQHLGYKALASTSAGYAWSTGRADNKVTCDDVIDHRTQLCAAVDLPVNADFEGGFADAPEGVAANVTRALATGVAGLSIEDSTGDKAKPLYDRSLAVERVAAARGAIDASGA
ncbi:MAG TPA: isocitrate lyase/phosphoenolpyruvate mutase family protein, partial [Xanthobacteraceae bacterium]|nr:isocitrate lyase/phosphoenolpyruvate mutase family protein [Xanthobacteraceae bacterium]